LKDGKILKTEKLKEIYEYLKSFTYQERMENLGLNHDRADVIIPASEIFLYIAKQAEIKDIIVPKIGLSDGIIREIYSEIKQKTS
jgi:exopolyphosphatase/guanosine-5'-triphosphate,3'-diphosphate pyrophosphatase